MKALALDGLGELYKCVGKAQQVITGLVTSAYNPSTLEAKANGSWVWGSLAALITWRDPVCQTAPEPCVATSADRRPDLNHLPNVGSVLSSCWQAAPRKPLCEQERGKSLQPVISAWMNPGSSSGLGSGYFAHKQMLSIYHVSSSLCHLACASLLHLGVYHHQCDCHSGSSLNHLVFVPVGIRISISRICII